MLKRTTILCILLAGLCSLSAQKEAMFSLKVSTDSLLMNNLLKVTFTLENAEAQDFKAPEFEGFVVAAGPNMSSSMSIINGDMSRSVAYTYYLQPIEVGNYYVAPASVKVEDTYLETSPQEIMVVPNPEGIRQPIEEDGGPRSRFWDDFPRLEYPIPIQPEAPKKKKKKRKTVRI